METEIKSDHQGDFGAAFGAVAGTAGAFEDRSGARSCTKGDFISIDTVHLLWFVPRGTARIASCSHWKRGGKTDGPASEDFIAVDEEGEGLGTGVWKHRNHASGITLSLHPVLNPGSRDTMVRASFSANRVLYSRDNGNTNLGAVTQAGLQQAFNQVESEVRQLGLNLKVAEATLGRVDVCVDLLLPSPIAPYLDVIRRFRATYMKSRNYRLRSIYRRGKDPLLKDTLQTVLFSNDSRGFLFYDKGAELNSKTTRLVGRRQGLLRAELRLQKAKQVRKFLGVSTPGELVRDFLQLPDHFRKAFAGVAPARCHQSVSESLAARSLAARSLAARSLAARSLAARSLAARRAARSPTATTRLVEEHFLGGVKRWKRVHPNFDKTAAVLQGYWVARGTHKLNSALGCLPGTKRNRFLLRLHHVAMAEVFADEVQRSRFQNLVGRLNAADVRHEPELCVPVTVPPSVSDNARAAAVSAITAPGAASGIRSAAPVHRPQEQKTTDDSPTRAGAAMSRTLPGKQNAPVGKHRASKKERLEHHRW